jgi:hypothetical protein
LPSAIVRRMRSASCGTATGGSVRSQAASSGTAATTEANASASSRRARRTCIPASLRLAGRPSPGLGPTRSRASAAAAATSAPFRVDPAGAGLQACGPERLLLTPIHQVLGRSAAAPPDEVADGLAELNAAPTRPPPHSGQQQCPLTVEFDDAMNVCVDALPNLDQVPVPLLDPLMSPVDRRVENGVTRVKLDIPVKELEQPLQIAGVEALDQRVVAVGEAAQSAKPATSSSLVLATDERAKVSSAPSRRGWEKGWRRRG